MKKIISILIFAFSVLQVFSQVGVGTTNPAGSLDIVSSNNGVLIPRVALINSTDNTTITTITESELVYHTGSVGLPTAGYYYWKGAAWVQLAVSVSNDWSITGNAGTSTATNFLGTTDAQDLRFKTGGTNRLDISNSTGQILSFTGASAATPSYSWFNDPDTGMHKPGVNMLGFSTTGVQRIVIGDTGNIGVATAVPATTKMEVLSSGSDDAIFGHTANVGGVLGRETNFSFGNPVQTILGSGLYANNPAAGYTSVYAQSTGAATVAANIAYSDVWSPSYNYYLNGSAMSNAAANYNELSVTNSMLGGFQIALRGQSNRGTTAGSPGTTVGVLGASRAQNQNAYGVFGQAYSDSTTRAGGYFSSYDYFGANQAYAYVGTAFGAALRKITGTAAVSEIIPTEKHGRITLTCPESPEYWYQDYGTVNMVNGKAAIILDEILADVIVVDEENPIRVICTPVGMPYFNGVTIMSQTTNSVEILELNGGNHSGKLQYQLVVKPKTGYGEGRFHQAPGPAYLKSEKEPLAAKAKNQPNDGRKIYQWPADHIVYKYNPEDYVEIGDIVPAGPNAGKTKLGNGKYGEGQPAKVINKK